MVGIRPSWYPFYVTVRCCVMLLRLPACVMRDAPLSPELLSPKVGV